MTDKEGAQEDMSDVDALFASAREVPPQMPKNLEQAILRDAAQVQARRLETQTQARSGQGATPERGLHRIWRQFSAAIGGWPALGGLAAASLVGLWVGVAPPAFLPDPVESFVAYSSGAQLISEQGYDVSLLMSEEVFE